MWTLEISDHSLGRLIERDPAADVDAVLWQAHAAVLSMKLTREDKFLVPAGDGCFLARLQASRDLDADDAPMVLVQTTTWLSNDMALDRLPLSAAASTLGERLGDNLFLPASLRHLWQAAA